MSPRRQSPLSLEYALLGFLYQRSIHGYDLHKRLNDLKGVSLIWRVKQSQLYALLEKLEHIGYVSSSLSPGEAHPMRREYHISPSGETAFLEWVQTPVYHGREMRQEFLARYYFARQIGQDTVVHLLQNQRQVCQGWLDDFVKQWTAITMDQSYERSVLHFRILQTKAMITWLDDAFIETNTGTTV